MSAPRVVPEPRMTERQWMSALCELAETAGWEWNHCYRGQVKGAWRTNTTKKGYPDLHLWRPGESIYIECKTDSGVLSPEQNAVLASLAEAQVEVHVYAPRDWDLVVKRLTR